MVSTVNNVAANVYYLSQGKLHFELRSACQIIFSKNTYMRVIRMMARRAASRFDGKWFSVTLDAYRNLNSVPRFMTRN